MRIPYKNFQLASAAWCPAARASRYRAGINVKKRNKYRSL
jgi:hypothetical protein